MRSRTIRDLPVFGSNRSTGQEVGSWSSRIRGRGGGEPFPPPTGSGWRHPMFPAAGWTRVQLGPGTCSYGFLLNWRSVIRGSIAAELSTFWEKAGATRMPRTLSAGTPLDSRFPR